MFLGKSIWLQKEHLHILISWDANPLPASDGLYGSLSQNNVCSIVTIMVVTGILGGGKHPNLYLSGGFNPTNYINHPRNIMFISQRNSKDLCMVYLSTLTIGYVYSPL